MLRWLMLGAFAVTAVTDQAAAQNGAAGPSYQRRRGEWSQEHYPRRGYYPYHAPRGRGPAVSAGTFQRPYPYHLDYYKKQYGGSYEPYFGNLYGPPNVVLGAPFGPYGFPSPYGYGFQPPYAAPAGPQSPPVTFCPHCRQPIEYAAPNANQEPSP